MSSKGSLWSHLKALCCDYVALLQNEDSTDAEFDTVIDRAAETIAAQHNLELARARSEKTELLPCGHPASVADDDGCAMCRLVAQVAMMAEALRDIKELVEPSIHLSNNDLNVWNIALDGLSAAPKVAWYGTMYIGEDSIGPVLMDPDPKCPWPELIRGQQVKVFVVECPPKAGQPTESEQEATDG